MSDNQGFIARQDRVDLLSGRLDSTPFTMLHLAVVLGCTAGFSIDLMEAQLGGALSAIFAASPYHFKEQQLSWLLSSVFVGAIVGAPLIGWLGNRIGPRLALTGVLIWLGLSSIGASLQPVGSLALWRMLTGVALGAYPPLMIAYLTDLAPRGWRGIVIFSVCAVAYLAPPAAIFSLKWLVNHHPFNIEPWRWPLLAGGLLSLVADLALAFAPEGPRWLIANGRLSAAHAVCIRFEGSRFVAPPRTADDPPMRGDTVAKGPTPRFRALLRLLIPVSAVFFLIPWATTAFPLITGPVLLARHFSLTDTLYFIALSTAGPAIGTFVGGLAVEQLDRRLTLSVCAVGMLTCVLMFLFAKTRLLLGSAVVLFGVFGALYLPTLTLFGAELFPAAVRGGATSVAWAANRVAAVLSTFVLVGLAQHGQSEMVACVIAAALLGTVALLFFQLPRSNPARRRTRDAS